MEWGNRCAVGKLRISFPKFCECSGRLTRTFVTFGRLKRRATPVYGTRSDLGKNSRRPPRFTWTNDSVSASQRCLGRLGESMNTFRSIHVSKNNTRETSEGDLYLKKKFLFITPWLYKFTNKYV